MRALNCCLDLICPNSPNPKTGNIGLSDGDSNVIRFQSVADIGKCLLIAIWSERLGSHGSPANGEANRTVPI